MEDLKEIVQKYYGNLYDQSKNDNREMDKYSEMRKLMEFKKTHKQILNDPVTMAEIDEVIKHLKKKKAPGPDGLPIEYYTTFKEELVGQFKIVVNEILVD